MSKIQENTVPDCGIKRVVYCLRESFSSAVNDHAKIYQRYVEPQLAKHIFAPKLDSRKISIITAFSAAVLVGVLIPSQAIGLYGLGIAYLGAKMKENRNMRTMYSLGCIFFAGQYLLSDTPVYAGAISAGIASVRGITLTMIPDNNRNVRSKVASAFFIVSAAGISASSMLNNQGLVGLVLIPGLALSVLADRMGDKKSHTARFLKLGAYGIVAGYDFLYAKNYGSGLASLLLISQILSTSKKAGDFDFGNTDRSVPVVSKVKNYMISLNKEK